MLIGTKNNNKHNEQQQTTWFSFLFFLCSYVDNKNRVLSLSPPSLSTKVIVRARSLVHSAELFNVISFSILSADFFSKKGREKIYIYIYLFEKEKKKKDKNRIESNTLNSINLFFFSRFIERIIIDFPSILWTTNIYILIDKDGRFDMSSSWRRKKDNVPQNKWSSIVVDVFLSRSTTTYIQLRKYVIRRWASRSLNSITILMNNDEYRVGNKRTDTDHRDEDSLD